MDYLPLIVLLVQIGVFARFFTRFGYSPIWAAIAIIPILPLIAIWVIAFTDWPIPDRREISDDDQDALIRDFS